MKDNHTGTLEGFAAESELFTIIKMLPSCQNEDTSNSGRNSIIRISLSRILTFLQGNIGNGCKSLAV
jgi:hypothetical protein